MVGEGCATCGGFGGHHDPVAHGWEQESEPMVSFGVITRVAGPESGGNLAAPDLLYRVVEGRSPANEWAEVVEPIPAQAWLQLRSPVFRVGEVLILDPGGREIPYPGRKPAKWDVDCEEFDELDAALARAREVCDGQ